jgi:hypothetical protein
MGVGGGIVFLCALLLLIGVIVFIVLRRQKLENLGYEQIPGGYLWKCNNTIYLVPNNNLKRATPVEVLEVGEIRQNSVLVQLEVCYRINGSVHSLRLKATQDLLLTAKYMLGYCG